VPWPELAAHWSKDRSGSDWNHVRRGVSRFLTIALGDKYHPFRREVVARIPIQREKVRVPDLTPSVFWEIIGKVREDVRPAFVTLVATGLRVGEYLRLTEEDLRPLTRRIVVPIEGKTGERIVPVAEELWNWVSAGVPSPLGYRRLWQHWHDACQAVGLPGLVIHDLRHCAGQWAHEAGVSLAMVKSLLGHSTITMTERYARTQDAGLAASAVARALNPKGARPLPFPAPSGGETGKWALLGSNQRPSDYENVGDELPDAQVSVRPRQTG